MLYVGRLQTARDQSYTQEGFRALRTRVALTPPPRPRVGDADVQQPKSALAVQLTNGRAGTRGGRPVSERNAAGWRDRLSRPCSG